MLRKFLTFALLAGFAALAAPAETENAPAANGAVQTTAQPVPAALAGMKYLQGIPDLNARYYIFLQSASWCGPCHMAMPYIVNAYQQLRDVGVEVILFSHDANHEGAMELAMSEKVPFPMLLSSDAEAANIPGYAPARGIPTVAIVTPDGRTLIETHPNYLFPDSQWRTVLGWYDAPRPAVKDALPQVTFLQGNPNPDAKYYVYIEVSNTCAPCHSSMHYAVEAYAGLKDAGVEVIMCSRDNESTARHYAQKHEVQFPVTLVSDGNADKLPGFHGAAGFGIPHVIMVTADGQPVWEGHPLRFFCDQEWKSYGNF